MKLAGFLLLLLVAAAAGGAREAEALASLGSVVSLFPETPQPTTPLGKEEVVLVLDVNDNQNIGPEEVTKLSHFFFNE